MLNGLEARLAFAMGNALEASGCNHDGENKYFDKAWSMAYQLGFYSAESDATAPHMIASCKELRDVFESGRLDGMTDVAIAKDEDRQQAYFRVISDIADNFYGITPEELSEFWNT